MRRGADRRALHDGFATADRRAADHHTYFVGDDEWGFSVWAHNQYIDRDSQGRKIFGNDMPERLTEELALADNLGIAPMVPTNERDTQLVAYANMAVERKLLWVQRLDGKFAFVPGQILIEGSPYTLNHTAAARGADVLGAGEAYVHVSPNGRVTIKVLNNRSGHYAPSPDILNAANEGLERLGFGVIR